MASTSTSVAPQGSLPIGELAASLQLSIGLVVRRLRQVRAATGELSLSDSSVLSRLDREGAASSAELARAEQITAQSMGATLAALEARDLIVRRPDAKDGRRHVVSVTAAGRRLLHSRRSASALQLAAGLASGFTTAELETLAAAAPLIERLAGQI